jgi:hypothetical protein
MPLQDGVRWKSSSQLLPHQSLGQWLQRIWMWPVCFMSRGGTDHLSVQVVHLVLADQKTGASNHTEAPIQRGRESRDSGPMDR